MSSSPEEIEYQEAHISDNIQPNIYSAVIVCVLIMYFAVALHFVACQLKCCALGKDNYTILAALVRDVTPVF